MAKKFKEMTPEELLESANFRFSYDEITGILEYKNWVSGMSRDRIGTAVGAVDGKGYLTAHFHGKQVKVHHIIWLMKTGEWPTMDIDHDNRDKQDNSWDNLNQMSSRMNQLNRSNNVEERYVYLRKDTGTFQVKLYDPNLKKSFNFGTYENIDQAVQIRNKAESYYPDISSAFSKYMEANL